MIRNSSIAAGLLALLGSFAMPAMAANVTVMVPEKSQPESITVAPDGALILGSATTPKIYRVKKGTDKPAVFVDVSADGPVSFLGVLADGPTNTLWACEIYTGATPNTRHSALRGFDLQRGTAKFRWDLPGEQNLCNDFVVGPDKALYISDTIGGRIWRLKPGTTTPELFSDDRTLSGIDGITFIGDTLYENNVIFNKLYRVPTDATGKAGKPVDLWTDKPIKGPDGMRAANGKLFLTENGAGKIDMVTVNGDTASITVLQDGLNVPTAIEPAGDTLWYGERMADKAHSMPLPK
jgi:sugar lactone lactonase YvrE